MRTGWCESQRNAPQLALAAQDAGVQMLTIHGRTRDQGYKGLAEYDTIAHIKSRVDVPVDVPPKAGHGYFEKSNIFYKQANAWRRLCWPRSGACYWTI